MDIKIKKEYRSLIARLLDYDSYEDIKSIIELGVMTRNVMIDYKIKNEVTDMNIQEKYIYEERIRNLEDKINNIKDMYDERIEKINTRLNQEKEEEIQKYKKRMKNTEEMFEKSHNELLNIKNSHFEKLQSINEQNRQNILKQEKELYERLNELKEEKNKEILYFKELLKKNDERFENMRTKELKQLEEEKNKEIERLRQENERFREKYEKIEVNSVLKGRPYEEALEKELQDYFEKNGNIFSIKRCSSQKGKGDFVITNNYSGVRIMLEAKNMACVSSTVKEQQPKFYNDLKDKTNQYDGGIIVAMGKIEGKKNYQVEVFDDNKVVSFVEKYSLNQVDKIVLILEILHQKIQEIKTHKGLSEKQVFENQKELYISTLENYKKIKQTCDNQYTLTQTIKNNILTSFKIDIDEYLSEKKTKDNELTKTITEQIEDYVRKEIERSNTSKNELKDKVCNEYIQYIELYKTDKQNGVSKQKITKIVNKLFEDI